MPRLAEVLDELRLDWVVAGAVAAERYREDQRFTTDLDLLVRWDDRIPDALATAGYDQIRLMADEGEHPHLVMIRGDVRVDLLVSVTPYQELAVERGLAARCLTIEDVIVHKLIAWRAKDRQDLEAILRRGDPLDLPYIEHWAGEWEVLDRWESVRSTG